MSTVIATRSELLARKSREGIAQRRHTLLTQKRGALIAELRRAGQEVGDKHAQLEQLAAAARRALAQAVVVDGPQAVASAAAAAGRPVPAEVDTRNAGIGAGSTRDDHRDLADQLYACYARGRQVRDLASIVGTAALGEDDRRYLTFADDFEQRFLNQGEQRRDITATLDLAWDLLGRFPSHELTRIRQRHLDRHHQPADHPPSQSDAARPG